MREKNIVSFIISGVQENPNIITDRLAIEPTKTKRIGDSYGKRSSLIYEYGIWVLRSRLGEELSFEAHIGYLLSILNNSFQELIELSRKHAMMIVAVIYRYGLGVQKTICLEYSEISILSKIYCSLDFDLYFYDEPDNEIDGKMYSHLTCRLYKIESNQKPGKIIATKEQATNTQSYNFDRFIESSLNRDLEIDRVSNSNIYLTLEVEVHIYNGDRPYLGFTASEINLMSRNNISLEIVLNIHS